MHETDIVIPLTWNQRGRLRREAHHGDRIGGLETAIPLGDRNSDAVRARLASIVSTQESLRVTNLSLSGDCATIRDDVEVPVTAVRVASAEELDEVVNELAKLRFARDGGPLWRGCIIDQGPRRTPRLILAAVFDHLISDGRSIELFHDALGNACGPLRPRRRFRDWTYTERREYPMDAELPTRAREFWLAYLDGTPPDAELQPSPLCPRPEAPLSGTVSVISRTFPLHPDLVRRAAKRLRATPFLLVAASVVSAVSHATGASALILRVASLGRAADYLDTYGWFSSSVPLRVADLAIQDYAKALAAVRSSWLRTLDFQATPWGYIAQVTRASAATAQTTLPATLDFNYVPFRGVQAPPESPSGTPGSDTLRQGQLGALKLTLTAVAAGGSCLTCEFDPARFVTAEVRALVDELCALFQRAIA